MDLLAFVKASERLLQVLSKKALKPCIRNEADALRALCSAYWTEQERLKTCRPDYAQVVAIIKRRHMRGKNQWNEKVEVELLPGDLLLIKDFGRDCLYCSTTDISRVWLRFYLRDEGEYYDRKYVTRARLLELERRTNHRPTGRL